MEEIKRLIAAEKWADALVGLWAMADFTTLAAWENARQAKGFDGRVDSLKQHLSAGHRIDAAQLRNDPLAVIRALDEKLTEESIALRFSATPYRFGEADYWLVPVDSTGRSNVALSRQSGKAHWFRRHAIIPARTAHGLVVDVVPATGALAQRLSKRAAEPQPGLRAWIGHFDDGLSVTWDKTGNPAGRWRALSFDKPDVRRKSLIDTLERARKAGAEVIVLPELSVDLRMRAEAMDWLQQQDDDCPLLMVLLGSFHESVGEAVFNTAPLVEADPDSCETLFVHRKLRVFGNLQAGSGGTDFAEAVVAGDRVSVLVSEMGSFTVLICKDFLDLDQTVATLLQEVPVDWVLVPSYGDEQTLEAHRERADQVARKTVGCHVLVANIRNVGISAGNALPGFAHPQGATAPTHTGPAGGLVDLPLPLNRTEPPSKGSHLKPVK